MSNCRTGVLDLCRCNTGVAAGVSAHGSTRAKRQTSATTKDHANSSSGNESAPNVNDIHVIFVGMTFVDSD